MVPSTSRGVLLRAASVHTLVYINFNGCSYIVVKCGERANTIDYVRLSLISTFKREKTEDWSGTLLC
jgi:hypothetical protein